MSGHRKGLAIRFSSTPFSLLVWRVTLVRMVLPAHFSVVKLWGSAASEVGLRRRPGPPAIGALSHRNLLGWEGSPT